VTGSSKPWERPTVSNNKKKRKPPEEEEEEQQQQQQQQQQQKWSKNGASDGAQEKDWTGQWKWIGLHRLAVCSCWG